MDIAEMIVAEIFPQIQNYIKSQFQESQRTPSRTITKHHSIHTYLNTSEQTSENQ